MSRQRRQSSSSPAATACAFDRKGVPGVSAHPTARLILATNHDPRFADRSKGIWRRMIVVPFNKSIPPAQQDTQLANKLKQELPGIFNWAIQGLSELRRSRQFTIPRICKEEGERYRRESNPAHEYLTDTYERASAEHALSCSTIYADYDAWCDVHGAKTARRNELWQGGAEGVSAHRTGPRKLR